MESLQTRRQMVANLKRPFSDVVRLSAEVGGLHLRRYQQPAALAIIDSVIHRKGLSFVVMFPRQSGKNELLAQLECYLLLVYSQCGAEMVKVSPTWKPQSLNAMRRLERVLQRNRFARPKWRKESGYIYRVDHARIFFFSGAPEANIVGATASTLLEVDEAQDVLPAKYDRDIAPMAASTNATRIFWGTAWTSHTLLARELRAARRQEEEDGLQRVFVLTAGEVSAEVPAYGEYVAAEVARMGRSHPMIRTQYFSEEIGSGGGMLNPERRALMQGSHPARTAPQEGRVYAMALDVAGEDESGGDFPAGGSRDSTALTVVEVGLETLKDDLLRAPTYRVVFRQAWCGVNHAALYGQIRALGEHWRIRRLVVDATGVGAGLASFLEKAFPGRVAPFVFTQTSKSRLGWNFLAAVDAGRYKEPAAAAGSPQERLQADFWRQADFCQFEVLDGPGRVLRWGVPGGARDPENGGLLHDDLLVSAALCTLLDGEPWAAGGESLLVPGRDPLDDYDRSGY